MTPNQFHLFHLSWPLFVALTAIALSYRRDRTWRIWRWLGLKLRDG